MAVGFVRANVADLSLRVFERSVHPELFETLCVTMLSVGSSRVTLRITGNGHVIEFRSSRGTITEVAASKFAPLPERACVIDRRLIGYRTHMLEAAGYRYHCSYQLETVPAEIYLQLHRELETDARRATLATAIQGSGECSPDCLSLLKCELLPEALVIHSVHTFPDNGAILRIQTLFERTNSATAADLACG